MELAHSGVTVRPLAPPGPVLGHGEGHAPGACETVGSVLSRIGDKWTVLIVMALSSGPRRFNELKRRIGGVSQRMLALSLRGLERDGLVTRTQYATIPPRVDYELTPLGHSLRVPLEALGVWAFANIPAIEDARHRYDAQETVSGNSAARVT